MAAALLQSYNQYTRKSETDHLCVKELDLWQIRRVKNALPAIRKVDNSNSSYQPTRLEFTPSRENRSRAIFAGSSLNSIGENKCRPLVEGGRWISICRRTEAWPQATPFLWFKGNPPHVEAVFSNLESSCSGVIRGERSHFCGVCDVGWFGLDWSHFMV